MGFLKSHILDTCEAYSFDVADEVTGKEKGVTNGAWRQSKLKLLERVSAA